MAAACQLPRVQFLGRVQKLKRRAAASDALIR